VKIFEREFLLKKSASRLWRRFLSALLLASFCATPAFAAANSRPQPALENPVFQALPLERSKQNHLLIRAEINGKPALLGVDSGAPVSAISASRRAYFGMSAVPSDSKLPSQLRINGGFGRVRIAQRLQLGALILLDEPMVAIDLSAPARAAHAFHEQELDGILGADILFPTQAVLDCNAQTLFMKIDPDAPGAMPAINHRGWKDVPIRVSKGWNLYVDSKLNGKAAQLMLDTGSFTTLIHRPFVRQMRLPLRNTPYASGAVNLKQRGLQLATIRRFAVGNFVVKGKEVGVMDLHGLIHGDLLDGQPPVVGLLGSEFFRRNHAIIDFGTRTLYLKL
jgi:predicted aspartyl protease